MSDQSIMQFGGIIAYYCGLITSVVDLLLWLCFYGTGLYGSKSVYCR